MTLMGREKRINVIAIQRTLPPHLLIQPPHLHPPENHGKCWQKILRRKDHNEAHRMHIHLAHLIKYLLA